MNNAVTKSTKKALGLAICLALILLGQWLFAGCAHSRAAGVKVPPVNPDIAPLKVPVAAAKAASKSATDSVARAVQIVTKLVPAPGQVEQINALKLELATTEAELKITSDKLDLALAQIPALEAQTGELMQRWREENSRAELAAQGEQNAIAKAAKEKAAAVQAGAERDIFVTLFAVSLTVFGLMAAAPLIQKFSASFGAYAPFAAVGSWIFAAVTLFFSAFKAIRALLHVAVTLIT